MLTALLLLVAVVTLFWLFGMPYLRGGGDQRI
jgi:hypothetical protein